jgi:hypothetical protein
MCFDAAKGLRHLLICLLVAQGVSAGVFANPEITVSDDQSTVIINDAPEQEVYVIGKSVVVKKRAKGVLAVGGDVTVEGRVEGDIATVGGNVIHKDEGYVGGDIIVFGGSYQPESPNALREQGRETVTFGVFEDELRDLGQNPGQLFSPTLSVAFIAQRLIVALFWFIVTLAITTLAPGAVSRAVARIQLSWLRVCGIGAGMALLITSLMIVGAIALPNYLSVTVGILGAFLLGLGYVFGRVALQVSVGKIIQRTFLAETSRSETLAVLIGVISWTALLSLPYVWLIALFLVFTFGIGLVVTGRTGPRWQTP